MPEVFTHSSNIGSAKMALGVGVAGHKAFLKKMGCSTGCGTELPESAAPIVPVPLERDQHDHHRVRPRYRGGADPGGGRGVRDRPMAAT